MFRRLPHTLPKDPAVAVDLESLGYFINDHDQIRQIRKPDQKYQFVVNRNDRVNDVYKEAMNTCVRRIVNQRMSALGMRTLCLPLDAEDTEECVPIWISPDISTKKRVIIIFGERHQDLGIFSYRVIGDEGIRVGSCLDFVSAVQQGPTATTDDGAPGIIIANPGQLHWYRGGNRAVTAAEWSNLPRQSAVHEQFRVDEVKNRIPGNRNYREHISYVFEHVLPETLHNDAKLDLIGLEYTGTAVVEHLASNWPNWASRVSAISLVHPQHKAQDLDTVYNAPKAFVDFLSKRCRAYFVSPERLETIMNGREEYGCNCYSSGEEFYQENAIVRSWRSMLDWFNLVHTIPDYQEAHFDLSEAQDGDSS